MDLVFAQIDTKNSDYKVIVIERSDGSVGSPHSEHNTKILYAAIDEYLEALNELQVRLSEKYGPQLEDESDAGILGSFCVKHCPCNHKYCENSKRFEDMGLFYT